MSGKRLLFKSAVREKVLRGVTALADAVRIPLGLKPKCVLIQKQWGRPIVCKDGITIAKEIELEDPEANFGAQMIREAAERTGEAVGDGTSSSSILAHAIDLKRGFDRGLQIAVRSSRTPGPSRAVASRKEKAQVAAIPAHNDTATREMVADAYKVGTEWISSQPESSTPGKWYGLRSKTRFPRQACCSLRRRR